MWNYKSILILFYYISSELALLVRTLLHIVLYLTPLLISQYFFRSPLQRRGMVLFDSDEGCLIESREDSIATALQLEVRVGR